MAYLLDTNTLIQAKNEYYPFTLCPGFWDWLDQENAAGKVFSIEPVLKEIRDGADDLVEWANERANRFFLPVDTETTTQLTGVVQWVQSANFKEEAKRDFLAKAYPILIAYALAHKRTLATHEVHIDGERRKVKIPTVCNALGVRTLRTFTMLTTERARFILAPRA